jgi:hypothetical protein
VTEPLVVRPRQLTRVARVVAVVTVVVFAVVGYALTRTTGDMQFGPVDQALMTATGLLLAGAALLFTRARVVAGDDGVRVRNAFGEKALPWGVVTAVRFDESSSWASLELRDDDEVALLAVQAADGDSAVEAVRALRALLEASQAAG